MGQTQGYTGHIYKSYKQTNMYIIIPSPKWELYYTNKQTNYHTHITLFLSTVRCTLHQSPGRSPTIHLSHSNSTLSPHKRDHSQSSAAWSLVPGQFSLACLSPPLPSFSDTLFFDTCWRHNETEETSVYNKSTNQTVKHVL